MFHFHKMLAKDDPINQISLFSVSFQIIIEKRIVCEVFFSLFLIQIIQKKISNEIQNQTICFLHQKDKNVRKFTMD